LTRFEVIRTLALLKPVNLMKAPWPMKRLHLKDAILDDEAFATHCVAIWWNMWQMAFDRAADEYYASVCVAPYECPDVQRAEGEGMPEGAQKP
jgi:hypothetical protein